MSATPEEEYVTWENAIINESNEIALAKLQPWLAPKTEGFFQAPSGCRLHVRAVLPAGGAAAGVVKGVVLYCHGLNQHVNTNWVARHLLPRIASGGLAVFALDIKGHGYSEGRRAYVEDWDLVFDDWEAFAETLLGVADPPPAAGSFCAGVPADVLQHLRGLPVFVVGLSMGGLIGMYLGLRFQESERLRGKFHGAVLLCPALNVDLPPKAVQFVLSKVVAPLLKYKQMPTAVSSSSKPKLCWLFDFNDATAKDDIEMTMRDCAARFPGIGLGWHENMLWGTAAAFAALYAHIEEDMRAVRYPLLVIHDPGDRICMFQGSQRLVALCQSGDKSLQQVDAGGFHAIEFNDGAVAAMTAWIHSHA